MTAAFAFVQDRCIRIEEAAVSAVDRGALYGDGLFETVRVRNGKAVRIEKHVERLLAGAEVLDMDLEEIAGRIADIVHTLMLANKLRDARVRLTVMRGPTMAPGLGIPAHMHPTVIATAHPLPEGLPEPARVVISSIRRDEASPLSRIKSLNCLPGILAMAQARKAGADDAILLNTKGLVAEGTVGNLFLVTGRTLVTPSLDQGPLPGTVRAAVIELAPKLGLEIVERAVTREELANADGAFFTNAIQLARPIAEIEGQIVGAGETGVCGAIRKGLDA